MTTQRALICSHYLPQPDIDSYSRRLFHFVGFLRDAGWDVACVARSPRGVDEFAHLLTDRGVAVASGFNEHEENVRQAATAARCDIAILGFWNFAEPLIRVLREVSPGTRLIVDSGDLHFLRTARGILRNAPARLGLLGPDFADATAREINVYAAADAVLAVSNKEAAFIGDLIAAPYRVHVVPDCEDFAASPVPFAERKGMFFVGNFEHAPNVEAVRFLCGEVLPQLDPDLLAAHPVYIAGSNLNDEVRGITAGWPAVKLLGWVPSVVTYFERVRVSLLPVLHGAGTKRKLIQALATGTPTVTTSIGAEGFDLRDGDDALIADEPFRFAVGIARLLTDAELWQRLATHGRERMAREHSGALARERLFAALAAARRGRSSAGAGAVGATASATDPVIPFVGLTTSQRVRRASGCVRPELSVVIPTRDRAALLDESLASLAAQTATGRFEVVVVSDGSTDETSAVCDRWVARLPLTVVESPAAGIAVAKNLGLDVTAAPLVLFFDDDDIAAPDLVARHLEMHRLHPLEHVAVLGHTDWAPRLHVTEVMRFMTEVGCYLFGYPHLRHGATYDYRFFWGGRASCKKSLLVRAGGFRPAFTFGSEDVEAAYRISRMLGRERQPRTAPKPASEALAVPAAEGVTAAEPPHEHVNMVVVYDQLARQQMIRPLTYDDVCRRCRRQGRSQWQFSRFYDDPRVAEWCGTVDAHRRWAEVRDRLPAQVARVGELERLLERGTADRDATVAELHRLYYHTFDACKLAGIVEAADEEHGP
ncbi:MAG: glycosyltransferase [Planctomycetaceae bacterium]